MHNYLDINGDSKASAMKEKLAYQLHYVAFENCLINWCKILTLPKVECLHILPGSNEYMNDCREINFSLIEPQSDIKTMIEEDYNNAFTVEIVVSEALDYMEKEKFFKKVKNLAIQARSSLVMKGIKKDYFSKPWRELSWLKNKRKVTLNNYQEMIGDFLQDQKRGSYCQMELLSQETVVKDKAKKVLL